MKAILLDTHVWIWLSLKKQKSLSAKAKNVIKSVDQKWISATITWIRRSLNQYHIKVADLSPEIAVESTVLRGFHKDPADQLITATSRILAMPLVTSDRHIIEFPEVDTIW